ncbi:MAG TPA: hypothetical protein VIQ02_09780 [Jiangellaceae bacterium]
MALPKPPVTNMTDFVVFCFVTIVAFILIGAMLSVMILEIRDPDTDTSSITAALADITTTLIGALVGFIAGKGAGKAEVHDEIQQLDTAQKAKASPKDEDAA